MSSIRPLVLAAVVLAGALKYLINTVQGYIGQKILYELRSQLYEHILQLPMPFFRKTAPGMVISFLTSELSAVGDFLGSVDYLVITLPLTRATEGILDEEALARMKKGACLINIARGRLIREEALVRALESGRLAGAGLDVFSEEPLPESSPLYRLPGVILTPHVGGLHPHYLDRATSLLIVNLGRYLKGEPLLHEVDKRSGY